MKYIKRFAYIIIIFAAITSCKRDKVRTSLLPNVTGKAGEVIIVMEKNFWQSYIGDTIRNYFMQEMIGLPQSEPILDLVNIPSAAFSSIFKSHRNIIQTYISKSVVKPGVYVEKDLEAKPQIYIRIEAPDKNSFMTLLMDNREKILGALLKMERKRLMDMYKNYPERSVNNILFKNHNVRLNFPKGFAIRVDTTDFMWISYETPLTSQGVFVYYYDYTDTTLFLKDSLLKKRNDLLKKYVPGPREGSFMTTEGFYTPECKEFALNKKYAVEIRGLWKVENDYMGGPFVSFSSVDEKLNRIVTVSGYVYAPKYDKRNYLRQVESILYSLKFDK